MTAERPNHDDKRARSAPSEDVLARFAAIVGPAHAIRDASDQQAYLKEWRDLYRASTPMVLRPASTDEVVAILALAHTENIGIVPQAGNTGLVGGQIPTASGAEIVLSVTRLNRVREVDAAAGTLTVDAGVTLADVQNEARNAGWMFPLSLASEGSARIGGVLATNAGGTAVLAYGNARQLTLGVEAVLADGRVYHGLRQLKKDNTGYDLRDLLIGSEGTLAVITAATLKLHPKPAETATAVAGVADPDALLALYKLASARAGAAMTAFEFWCAEIEQFARAATPSLRAPLDAPQPWSVMIEMSSGTENGQASATLVDVLEAAFSAGIVSTASVAATGKHAADFWRLRESFSESQKSAGGSIKHDVSLPIGKLPAFLAAANAVVQAISPGARPVPFGHFGDGNVHYNVSQPIDADKAAYLALWPEMSRAVHDLVMDMGGSFSAEHGIGQLKRDELARLRTPVELDMMRAIKTALDPKGILNPGKIL